MEVMMVVSMAEMMVEEGLVEAVMVESMAVMMVVMMAVAMVVARREESWAEGAPVEDSAQRSYRHPHSLASCS